MHFWRACEQRERDRRGIHYGAARQNQCSPRRQHNGSHLLDERCRQPANRLAGYQEQSCGESMSVPEILTPLIPEILARLGTSRKDRKLLMLRLCRKRREEDVGDAETTRSRDFAEGRSC